MLAGDHQIENAAQAIACLVHLTDSRFPTPPSQGPQRRRLARPPPTADKRAAPGRPPPGVGNLGDGGHNGAAGIALARQAARWKDRPLALMVGMLKSKDPRVFLESLAPHTQLTLTLKIPGEDGAWSAEDLAKQATAAGMTALESGGPHPAAQRILSRLDRPGRILICGITLSGG